MLNILLVFIVDIVSKIISLVIFVCLAMWSIRNLKVHDVSCASATLHLVIITTVSKGLLYSTGGPAERSIIRSIIGTITHNIPCKGCDRSYIGETARPIKERITEHKRDVRLRRTDNSAVAEHAWDNQHQPDWDGVQCLSQERHWYTRRVKEAINIAWQQEGEA